MKKARLYYKLYLLLDNALIFLVLATLLSFLLSMLSIISIWNPIIDFSVILAIVINIILILITLWGFKTLDILQERALNGVRDLLADTVQSIISAWDVEASVKVSNNAINNSTNQLQYVVTVFCKEKDQLLIFKKINKKIKKLGNVLQIEIATEYLKPALN